MRKVIIIGVQILLLILFLRTEFAQHLFGGLATNATQWYQNITELPERSKIGKLRDQFFRNNMALKPHQTDYVVEVTENTEEIDRFYLLYCIREDKNPYIYGSQLTKLCSDIRASELLSNSSL